MDLTNLLGGIWFRIAAGAIGAGLLFGGGAYVGHHWESVELADNRAEQALQAAQAAGAALKRFEDLSKTVHQADTNYGETRDQLLAKLDSISKGLRNAIKPAPLPPDCRPDAARVHALNEAVSATNAATDPATAGGFGETVRTYSAAEGR